MPVGDVVSASTSKASVAPSSSAGPREGVNTAKSIQCLGWTVAEDAWSSVRTLPLVVVVLLPPVWGAAVAA